MLEREVKRKKLVKKYSEKRKILVNQLKKENSLEEIFEINEKLQKLPRNSSPLRLRNRCWKTGKPRGYSQNLAPTSFLLDSCTFFIIRGRTLSYIRKKLMCISLLWGTKNLEFFQKY